MNFKQIAPVLLTVVSVATSVAAVIMAVHETPNAIKILDDHRLEVDYTGESDLVWHEKLLDYGKGYWKTGLLLGASVATSITSCCMSHRNYKALAASAAALSAAYTKHKDKVREFVGEEKAKLINKQVSEDLKSDEFSEKKFWFQEPVSGEFFQSTLKDVYEAEYEANKRIALEGFVSIGEIFPIKNSPKTASNWIWTQDDLCEAYGYPWIDFIHERVNSGSEDGALDFNFNEGRETYVIRYGIWPMPLGQAKKLYGVDFT